LVGHLRRGQPCGGDCGGGRIVGVVSDCGITLCIRIPIRILNRSLVNTDQPADMVLSVCRYCAIRIRAADAPSAVTTDLSVVADKAAGGGRASAERQLAEGIGIGDLIGAFSNQATNICSGGTGVDVSDGVTGINIRLYSQFVLTIMSPWRRRGNIAGLGRGEGR